MINYRYFLTLIMITICFVKISAQWCGSNIYWDDEEILANDEILTTFENCDHQISIFGPSTGGGSNGTITISYPGYNYSETHEFGAPVLGFHLDINPLEAAGLINVTIYLNGFQCEEIINFSVFIVDPYYVNINEDSNREFLVEGCDATFEFEIIQIVGENSNWEVEYRQKGDFIWSDIQVSNNQFICNIETPHIPTDEWYFEVRVNAPDTDFCTFQKKYGIPVVPLLEKKIIPIEFVNDDGSKSFTQIGETRPVQEFFQDLIQLPTQACCGDKFIYNISQSQSITHEKGFAIGASFNWTSLETKLGQFGVDVSGMRSWNNGSGYSVTRQVYWNKNSEDNCITAGLAYRNAKVKLVNRQHYCDGTYMDYELAEKIIHTRIIVKTITEPEDCEDYYPPGNSECNDGIIDGKETNSIRNNDDILAWFTPSLSSLCTYSFQNQSCGDDIEEYYWNFDDGSISTEQHPGPHEFPGPGTYTVSLEVTNEDGEFDLYVQTIIIESCNPFELTGEIYGPENVSAGDTYEYDVVAVGGVGPYTYQWDFGDVIPAAEGQEHEVSFSEEGQVTFQVKVIDSNDEITFLYKDVDVGYGGENIVDFIHGPVIENTTVFFTPVYNWFDMDGSETLEWFVDGNSVETTHFFDYLMEEETIAVKLKVRHNGDSWESEEKTLMAGSIPSNDVCVMLRGGTTNMNWTFTNNQCSCGNPDLINLQPINVSPNQMTFWEYHWWNQNPCSSSVNIDYTAGCGSDTWGWFYQFRNQNTGKVVTNENNPPFGYQCGSSFEDRFFSVALDDPGCWDIRVAVRNGSTWFPEAFYECAVFVEPDELEINNIVVTQDGNECDVFFLTPDISGGLTMEGELIESNNDFCHGLENIYKNYWWECTDLQGNAINVLFDDGYGTCAQVDIDNEYFDDLYSDRRFIVKLTIEDHLGIAKSLTKEINLGQKLNLRYPNDVYACSGTEVSIFGDGSSVGVEGGTSPGALEYVDGSHPFDYLIGSTTDGLLVTNELFESGFIPYTFGIRVTDENQCEDFHTVKLHVKGLDAHAGDNDITACGQASTPGTQHESFVTLGDPDGTATGGSGPYSYTYQWSPAYLLDDYRKEHPTVLKGEPNDTQIFTVTVTDNSGCVATDEVVVNYSDASNLTLQAFVNHYNVNKQICFATPDERMGRFDEVSCIRYNEDGSLDALCSSTLNYQWGTTHPYDWEPGNVRNPILPLEMTSTPGNFDFMLTITDPVTGCSATDIKNNNIREKIRYQGYESEPIWQASQLYMKLWNDQNNRVIIDDGGAQPPLTYEWVDKADNDLLSFLTYENDVPSYGAVSGPLLDGRLKMRVTDALDCEVDIPTNYRLGIEPGGAQIKITPYSPDGGDGAIVCAETEICWEIELDSKFTGQNLHLLPNSISIDVTMNKIIFVFPLEYDFPLFSEELELTLIDSRKGIYKGSYCYTPPLDILPNEFNPTRLKFEASTDLGGYLNTSFNKFEVRGDHLISLPYVVTFCGDYQNTSTAVRANHVIASPDTDEYGHIGNHNGKCQESYMPEYSGIFRLNGGAYGFIKVAPEDDNVKLIIEENNYFSAAISPCIYSYRPQAPLDDSIPNVSTLAQHSSISETEVNVEDISSTFSISIYPNPFTNQIQVNVNFEWSGELVYTLYNMMGEIVSHQKVSDDLPNGQPITIDGSTLHAGMYLLQIDVNDEKFVSKIIKN